MHHELSCKLAQNLNWAGLMNCFPVYGCKRHRAYYAMDNRQSIVRSSTCSCSVHPASRPCRLLAVCECPFADVHETKQEHGPESTRTAARRRLQVHTAIGTKVAMICLLIARCWDRWR